jgi:hypothetical protein
VAKVPAGDELLRALATIDKLQETVGKHAEVLNILLDRLAQMDKRISAVERTRKP